LVEACKGHRPARASKDSGYPAIGPQATRIRTIAPGYVGLPGGQMRSAVVGFGLLRRRQCTHGTAAPAWRPRVSIASPARPASGRDGSAAWGRPRRRLGPDRRGCPDRQGWCGPRARTCSGAGRRPTQQPTSGLPGGRCRGLGGWQRWFRTPASRCVRPSRPGAWEGRQDQRRPPRQTRQGRGQAG